MKSIIFSIFSLFILSSCTKCNECTLTTKIAITDSTTNTITYTQEYCGTELKDIEELGSYQKGDSQYTWVCTE